MHVQSVPVPVPIFLSHAPITLLSLFPLLVFSLLYPCPLPVLPFLFSSNRLLLLSLTDMQTTAHNLIPSLSGSSWPQIMPCSICLISGSTVTH